MKNIIVGLSLALASSISNAQIIKGSQLKEWVAGYERIEKGGNNSFDLDKTSSAIAYVTAVAESFDNVNLICLPSGATVGQLVAVVGRYLDENPDKWNRPANALTFAALAKAFPCQKK